LMDQHSDPVMNCLYMKAKKIRQIQSKLFLWYKKNKRPLPWRETDDPYCIWVSEVMLQQTQVNTVLPYYRTFLLHFPNVQSLAEADINDVLKVWEGMGYYARARNLHRAAKTVVEKHQGKIPGNRHDIRRLSGVEDYIGIRPGVMAVLKIGHNHDFIRPFFDYIVAYMPVRMVDRIVTRGSIPLAP